jgi:phosphatidate cytidylyltransferase
MIGKHKMIPHISPAKSWEGAGGAVLGSLIAATGMMLADADHLLPLTWMHAIIFAVLLCIIGLLGDLAESILKRCHGIKDSGHTLPGIGGILDLTDSLLFAGPVAYLYLRLIS